MKFLLDTHYLIWSIADSSKISKKIKDIIVDPDNRIFVSTISFWEISLKCSIGKLDIKGFLSEDIPNFSKRMGFEIETLSAHNSSSYHQLIMKYHKDPFDWMLIWQAISNGYTLISEDDNIKKFVSTGLKLLR